MEDSSALQWHLMQAFSHTHACTEGLTCLYSCVPINVQVYTLIYFIKNATLYGTLCLLHLEIFTNCFNWESDNFNCVNPQRFTTHSASYGVLLQLSLHNFPIIINSDPMVLDSVFYGLVEIIRRNH